MASRRPATRARALARAPITSIALIGAAAGLRSMTPFALLARRRTSRSAPRWLRSRGGQIGFALAALGELVGDKLPMAPSRLSAFPLAGRALNGALSGGVVARDRRVSTLAGVLIGAGAAVLGAFVGNKIRARAVKASGLPDPLVAIVEDVLAVGLGLLAV